MTLKNRAGSCGCCGCDIFEVTDLLTETTDVTVIDGFKVYDKPIDLPGLWKLSLTPRFTGTYLTTPAPKLTYRLLKDDNSVFAEWSCSRNNVANSRAVRRVDVNQFTWNGTAVFSDTKHSTAAPINSVTNSLLQPHSIVVREAYAACLGIDVFDSIENFFTGTTYEQRFDINGNPDPSGPFSRLVTYGAEPDPDQSTRNNAFLGGFSLPYSAAIGAAAGPLRVGVHANLGTGNSCTVAVLATKIRQEEIACDYGYSEEITVQREKNKTCENVGICFTSHPHYTTPLWEVVDAVSDVTLSSNEILTTLAQCSCESRYGTINEYQNDMGYTEVGGQPRAGYAVGTLNYNAADFSLPFVSTGKAVSEGDPPFVAVTSEVGIVLAEGVSNYSESSYTPGPSLPFRTSDFPFRVSTTVLATDNPCDFKVRCDFRIDAWYPRPLTETQYESRLARLLKIDVTDAFSSGFFYPDNPQHRLAVNAQRPAINYGFSAELINGSPLSNEPVHFARYEKTVPAWLHQPPTLSFTSADLISTPATWNILTGFTNHDVTLGPLTTIPNSGGQEEFDLGVRYDFVLVPVDTNSIAFTLRAHSAPRVPHP